MALALNAYKILYAIKQRNQTVFCVITFDLENFLHLIKQCSGYTYLRVILYVEKVNKERKNLVLISLLNGIKTYMGYLMQKPFF